mgnify:CR=1 FL=1
MYLYPESEIFSDAAGTTPSVNGQKYVVRTPSFSNECGPVTTTYKIFDTSGTDVTSSMSAVFQIAPMAVTVPAQ